jgi:FMN-dependent NADH-azoreductase
MKLLHLDSSILGEGSISRQLSAAVVQQWRDAAPAVEITYRDLAADPIPHLTTGHLPNASPESRAVLDQFLAADVIVIGAPMYNFTLPSQLKSWIDRIVAAGETFRYSEQGPEGLAGSKRVIILLSRGGFYGPNSPAAVAEHAETYLRAVFGFLGIVPEIIVAEGTQMGPEQRAAAVAEAEVRIADLAA